jgi:2-keto-3-deoxy-L-rhamnonate aldolase RhmA
MTQTELIKARALLKKKLRNREKTFAGWTSFGHPSLTEIIAASGVDFIGIDLEHSTISQEQNQRIIAAAQGLGVLALPRIASHNREMVKRVLDSGADGMIVPLVSSKSQAEEILSWGLYPPAGIRNFGVARAQGYGFDYAEYTKNWNKSFIFIVQIETKEGVENIDDILSVDGIDGAMVGPYDLSGSYGVPGQLDHALVKQACLKINAACKRAGKSCGTQLVNPDNKNTAQAFKDGFNFLVLSSDLFAMWTWGDSIRKITASKS